MGAFAGPEVVGDGLVFAYDMENTKKSWKGKPTTNFIYFQNAKPESSYEPHLYTTDTTWLANHPDAIICHNYQGGTLSSYVNRGVNGGNWQVTHHAHWQLDPILKKPVVVMRDFDGQWKAKYFAIGQSMTSMGLGYGDTYTISWLQWTDNIGKSVNAGLYGLNTSGANGFHDGQSQSKGASAFNTKPYTWQRLYATFTVSSTRDLGAGLTMYMYGNYNSRNTIKIADVQLETGNGSFCIENGGITRSNTEALLDLTGNNTITTNSLTYNSDGTFEFDGQGETDGFPTGDYIEFPTALTSTHPTNYPNGCTYDFWLNVDTDANDRIALMYGSGTINHIEIYSSGKYFRTEAVTQNGYSFGSSGFPDDVRGVWSHFSIVFANDETGRPVRWYQNGKLFHTGSMTNGGNPDGEYFYFSGLGRATGSSSYFYATSFKGKISAFKIYNKALTASEIKQNFNATRGRYGI